jgi:hypothetical protein
MTKGSEIGRPYYTDGGKISGAVYSSDPKHWEFISEVMKLNIESNPLHVVEFQFIG